MAIPAPKFLRDSTENLIGPESQVNLFPCPIPFLYANICISICISIWREPELTTGRLSVQNYILNQITHTHTHTHLTITPLHSLVGQREKWQRFSLLFFYLCYCICEQVPCCYRLANTGIFYWTRSQGIYAHTFDSLKLIKNTKYQILQKRKWKAK